MNFYSVSKTNSTCSYRWGRWADQWYQWASWLMKCALCQCNSIFNLLNEPLFIHPLGRPGKLLLLSTHGWSFIHPPYIPLLLNFTEKVTSNFAFAAVNSWLVLHSSTVYHYFIYNLRRKLQAILLLLLSLILHPTTAVTTR